MNNIITLIVKDFYEYKNNFIKTIINVFITISAPIIMFKSFDLSSGILTDTLLLIEIMLIIFILISYCETTMFQSHRNRRDGIYEKYYINVNIKNSQIVLSKFIGNLFISYSFFLIIMLINNSLNLVGVVGYDIVATSRILLLLIPTCWIGTCLALLSTLVITDEKNAGFYGVTLFLIYIGFYKVIEILNVSNMWVEIMYLVIICFVLFVSVMYVLNNNKLIKRD